jgi:hypothetical protein
MRKLIIGIAAIIIVGVLLYAELNRPYDEAYAIPEGFTGCAYVVYNVEGAPPLKVKDNTIQYKLDKDGIMVTSSPEDFGWEGKEHSGFHKITYFYVDENGNKIADIPEDMIGQRVLGSYDKDGKAIVTRVAFSVGDTNARCDTNYDDLLKKLKEKIKQ